MATVGSRIVVLLLLFFVLLPMFAGAVLSNAEILRPYTGPQDGERRSIENGALRQQLENEAQRDALRLHEEAAQSTRELTLLQAQSEADRQMIAERARQQMVFEARWRQVQLNLAYLLIGAVSIGLAVGMSSVFLRLAHWIPFPGSVTHQAEPSKPPQRIRQLTRARSVEPKTKPNPSHNTPEWAIMYPSDLLWPD